MVDIQTVSIAVASTSIVLAAIYYVLQLRHQTRIRQTDLVMRMYLAMGSEDMKKARLRFLALKIGDYDGFVKKYGPPFSAEPSQIWEDIDKIGWFFNAVGLLVHRELANVGLVADFFGYGIILAWEKMKPLVYGWREQYNMPKSFEWFEYVYNELKKREQLASKTA